MQFAVFFSSVVVFGAFFLGVHVAHFRWRRPRVVLKATLQDCLIGTGLGLLFLLLFCGNLLPYAQCGFALFSAVAVFVLLTAVYAILGPTMADRSVSVLLLIFLRGAPGMALSEQEMFSRFSMDAILRKRFEEHRGAGAIVIENGTLKLTARGEKIADAFKLILKCLRLE